MDAKTVFLTIVLLVTIQIITLAFVPQYITSTKLGVYSTTTTNKTSDTITALSKYGEWQEHAIDDIFQENIHREIAKANWYEELSTEEDGQYVKEFISSDHTTTLSGDNTITTSGDTTITRHESITATTEQSYVNEESDHTKEAGVDDQADLMVINSTRDDINPQSVLKTLDDIMETDLQNDSISIMEAEIENIKKEEKTTPYNVTSGNDQVGQEVEKSLERSRSEDGNEVADERRENIISKSKAPETKILQTNENTSSNKKINADSINSETREEQENSNSSENRQVPDKPTIHEKPKMVLVLTESRHGSTWLMDLLSWPETSVPVFEPMLTPFLRMYATSEQVRAEALQEGYDPVEYGDWRAVILARICLCDFNGRKIKQVEESGRKYGSIHGLGYKARRLGTKHSEELAKSVAICEQENSLIVPKTIRLYNITELSLLPELGCNNFKIIHLVRDPRAVLLSRMKVFHELYDGCKLLGEHLAGASQELFSEEYMRRAASDLCTHHLHSYQVGMNPPDWLKDRYKLVRYEDLAAHPDRWAASLVHFAGARYTAAYKEYVYNTTHVKDRGEKDRGNYAVERQTTEIVDSWRTKLLESHWRVIEEECAEMMDIMGYTPDFHDKQS